MPLPTDRTNPAPEAFDLEISGKVPVGLSGHLIGVGRDGVVHSFRFHNGHVAYRANNVGTRPMVEDLVVFEGSILVYGDDSSVRQLTSEFGNPRVVDLAGRHRMVSSCPTYDAASGELHVVAGDWGGSQVHVVVPAGALTRRFRPIADAPARVEGLAIGRNHAVYLADGVAGIAPLDGDRRTTWTTTDAAAPHPVHTYRRGNTVVLIGLTPSLERWSFHHDRGIERDVLDPTAPHFAHTGGGIHGTQQIVWTAGHETIGRHDVVESHSRVFRLAPHSPGDFVVVPDAGRPDSPDAGWLVGFVHHPSGDATDLRVLDAADVDSPVLATIRIPRPTPRGLRCAWLASTRTDPPNRHQARSIDR